MKKEGVMRDMNKKDKIGIIVLLGLLSFMMLVICIIAIFETSIPGICRFLLGAITGACIEWLILVINEVW